MFNWLDEDWKRIVAKGWSIWGIIFHALVVGLYMAWPAFQDRIPLFWFCVGSIAISLLLIPLRLAKQWDD